MCYRTIQNELEPFKRRVYLGKSLTVPGESCDAFRIAA